MEKMAEVVALPETKRLPVVVAPPLTVSPPVWVPLPMVLDAETITPIVVVGASTPFTTFQSLKAVET